MTAPNSATEIVLSPDDERHCAELAAKHGRPLDEIRQGLIYCYQRSAEEDEANTREPMREPMLRLSDRVEEMAKSIDEATEELYQLRLEIRDLREAVRALVAKVAP